jgi:hypothetical protein
MLRLSCLPRLFAALGFAVLVLATATLQAAEGDESLSFKKIVLTTNFYAEAAAMGDFNKDGKMDVVYGPQWYAGPSFEHKQTIYPIEKFDPHKYSNNFMTAVHDVNGDGYDDVLVNEWPGKAVHWFENPQGKDELWKKHIAYPAVDNESPQFGDITGDGKSELIFHTAGRLGYAQPNSDDPTGLWRFTPVSAKEKWGRYQHGLGFGDVNGDGKHDLLMVSGWWEQPSAAAQDPAAVWKKHPAKFGKRGGAQMYAYDVDGDGDRDIITSLDGHGYGLVWYEQSKVDGKVEFTQHTIVGDKKSDNPHGVKFSQIHAICLVDMDGDGLKDIVTGKRYWAHGPKGDVEPGEPAVLYWFKLVRTAAGGVEFTAHQIDDDSGVGTQFAVGDLNADQRPDIVVGNKKGCHVFIQMADHGPKK